MNKKWVSALLVVALVLCTITLMPYNKAANAEKAIAKGTGTFDAGMANTDKLIQMLKNQGVIAQNASMADAEKAVQKYLSNKAKYSAKTPGALASKEKAVQEAAMQKLSTTGLVNGMGNKVGQKTPVDPVQNQTWNGQPREDKVLALLIEYPDFHHNSMKPGEADLLYPDFSRQHYQDMLFSSTGYTGPNGEKLISFKQFYEQQSGGSFTVSGTVGGWYMAKYPAAYYGKNVPAPDGDDNDPRSLVKEALMAAAQDPTLNLADYDKLDIYDMDGDGNYNEPDGIIDHLMVFHAGVGEDGGGGSLGADAIWAHSWDLGDVFAIPGTRSTVNYWGRSMAGYAYTIQSEDGAAGVVSHEFGHDLGLPDEYDTEYTGSGEPIEYWSIMSAGSWVGKIPGTEPSGFSPYAKQYFQARYGGNWLTGATINYSDITAQGIPVLLDQASSKGTNNDAIRINLPPIESVVNTPYAGTYEYFSGKGDDVDNSMSATVNLTAATTARLNFKTWYDIEQDWDYASIQVRPVGTTTWTAIPGNITTTTNPNQQNPGNGITGTSNGWVAADFDLSAYAGKTIELRFNYWTDGAAVQEGFYVDDIVVTANGAAVLSDNAEGTPAFTMNGFSKSTGKSSKTCYYLLEWRNHQGVDTALAHIARGKSLMTYDPGLLVWFVDESYSDNWVGVHPGYGYLGIVDADQNVNYWSDRDIASTRYQMHDAAFSLQQTAPEYLDYTQYGYYFRDNQTTMNPIFDDSKSYISNVIPDAGKILPNFGIKIRVVGESSDRSAAKIMIYR